MPTLSHLGFTPCLQQTGFSALAGPFFEKLDATPIIRAFSVQSTHLNPEGVVHGGALLTFADYIIYRAIGDEIGHHIKFATINLNSNFTAAAKASDDVFGHASIIRKTKSVIFAEGKIFTDKQTIMQASGIWKIIGGN